jgi:hypothetical protein
MDDGVLHDIRRAWCRRSAIKVSDGIVGVLAVAMVRWGGAGAGGILEVGKAAQQLEVPRKAIARYVALTREEDRDGRGQSSALRGLLRLSGRRSVGPQPSG